MCLRNEAHYNVLLSSICLRIILLQVHTEVHKSMVEAMQLEFSLFQEFCLYIELGQILEQSFFYLLPLILTPPPNPQSSPPLQEEEGSKIIK